MRSLPFEILTATFSYLKKADLLQCQLTSKEWFEASVGHLYSKVDIPTSERSRLYTRTISNSLRLGSYLKTFNTGILFKASGSKPIWDEHGLINEVIRKCPNLLVIKTWEADLPFWNRIIHALTRGQLPSLQELEFIHGKCLEPYIYTVLLLKKTLVSLSITDPYQYFGVDLNRLEAYQTLLHEISEFEKLQSLRLGYNSNKPLSYYDSLMDDIRILKEIYINHFTSETKRQKMIVEPGKSINPLPNVRILGCPWHMINNESQLRYVMHKFPNLQKLIVCNNNFFGNRDAVDPSMVIEFLRYAISIPEFEIDLELKYEDAIIVWTKLTSMNEIYRDTILEYCYNETESFSDDIHFNISEKRLTVQFPINQEDVEFTHTQFLSKTGGMIQSLTLNISDNPISGLEEPTDFYIDFDNLDWIIGILELCPSLQVLTLTDNYANNNYFSGDVPLNINVKELTVVNVVDETTPFLNDISVIHPNIKHVCLNANCSEKDLCFEEPVIINIKNASLELFTWTNPVYRDEIDNNFKVYIKLTTDNSTKYYIGNINGLSPISEQNYEKSAQNYRPSLEDYEQTFLQNMCFEITCKSLAEFRINVKHSSLLKKFKWNF